MVAQVIVDVVHTNVARPFSYRVPQGMQAAIGSRVLVPLGPRRVDGVVIGFADESELDFPAEKLRPIAKLLDDYRKMSVTIGQPVKVLDIKGEYEAFAIEVNKDGHLLVEKPDKSRLHVFADEVSVRGIYGYVPESL